MTAPSPEAFPDAGRGQGRGVALLASLAFALGLVARLRAAAFPADEMFRSFPTEDGYLMLTVARNLALGRGLTSAAGTLPTNGVQPLATFVQAGCFWLAGGDRAAGVRLLLVVYTGVAVVTAALLHRLGVAVLGTGAPQRRAALLGAAAWFASPVTLFHSMNMLETGLYAAAVVSVVLFFARGHDGDGPWPARRCLALGVLLGVSFWARNDAVFLMAAVGVAHLAASGARSSPARRLAEAALMAVAAAACALPWLVYGIRGFGSVMPVSGRAYFGSGDPGVNAPAAALALFEYATLLVSFEYAPIRGRGVLAAAGLAGLVLAGAGTVLAWRRLGPDRRAVTLVFALFAAGLLAFYVLFFRAPHFLRRYLFPLSPFLALAWGAAAAGLWDRLAASRLRLAGPLLAALLLANFAVRDALLVRGRWRQDPFFRAVEWVDGRLDADTWVGAFQSGTLGFFHDRTINLDGKVNPDALRAIQQRRQAAYVVGSPIQYILDWASILEPWSRSDAVLSRHFDWVLRDPRGNFAVLGRRGAGGAMKPILELGPVELSTYVLMLSLGGCVAFWLTFREIDRKRVRAGPTMLLAVIAFLGALVGARALSVLILRPLYADQPWSSLLAVWDRGGMALYGGLVLAAALGFAYLKLRKLPVWDAADTLVAAWLPFLFFIRIGCFLNGCCYGRPTTSPFGMVAGGPPNAVNFGIRSHPAQLYDAAAVLLIFALVWWLRTRRRFEGQLAVTFLALYPAWKFFHESLRGDPWIALRFGRLSILTLNQAISIVLVVFAVVAGAALYATSPRPSEPNAGGA